MQEEYYKPGQITFRRKHIVWILEHIDIMRQGIYPPDPRRSGYVDSPGKQNNASATFEKACQLAGEVDARLNRCGIDGLMVRAYFTGAADESDLARHTHMTVYDVTKHIRSTMSYCVGYRRKGITYKEHKNHRGKHDRV